MKNCGTAPENDRCLGSPAVRIAVPVVLPAKEVTGFVEHLDDGVVGVEDVFANQLRQTGFRGEIAGVIDRRQQTELVFLAGPEVVGSVTGRDVDRAGAGVDGDEIGEDDLRVAVEKRVPRGDAVEIGAAEFRAPPAGPKPGLLAELFQPVFGHDQILGAPVRGAGEFART